MLNQNSRCLAFHGPLLYEAKILAISEPGGPLPLPSAIAEAHSTSKSKGKTKRESTANKKTDTPEPDQKGQQQDAIIKNEDNMFADSQIDNRDLIDKRAYFIHYKGWKSTWDEWVTEDRVLEWTDENLRTQRELKQQALQQQREQKAQKQVSKARDHHAKDVTQNLTPSTSTQTRGKSSTVSSPAPDDNIPRGVKRAREIGIAEFVGDVPLKRAELNIQIPDELKALLVDDWEYVTKNHQLVTLPRSPTVAQTISQYKDAIISEFRRRQKMNDDNNKIKEEDQDVDSALQVPILRPLSDGSPVASTAMEEILDEFLAGLKLYFDRCLGNMLLYRFERQQFLEWTKQNKKANLPPSEAYGPEHFLRLFVSLPELISQTHMDPQSIQVLKDHVTSFLWYLVQHKDSLFQHTYENTSPAYESLSRGL